MTNGDIKQAVVAIIQQGDKFLFIQRSDYVEAAKGYWCPVSESMLTYNSTSVELAS